MFKQGVCLPPSSQAHLLLHDLACEVIAVLILWMHKHYPSNRQLCHKDRAVTSRQEGLSWRWGRDFLPQTQELLMITDRKARRYYIQNKWSCCLTASALEVVHCFKFSSSKNPFKLVCFSCKGTGFSLRFQLRRCLQEGVGGGFNHRGHGFEFLQSQRGFQIQILICSVWLNKPKSKEAVSFLFWLFMGFCLSLLPTKLPLLWMKSGSAIQQWQLSFINICMTGWEVEIRSHDHKAFLM